ncbi:MAG: hypothetical protein MUE69_12355, partial [Myxococcota bacterium]|nr:hypothetical protein [Myxococcota bacterium]
MASISRRVLYVDGHRSTSSALRETLRGCCVVSVAASDDEAQRLLERTRFSGVLVRNSPDFRAFTALLHPRASCLPRALLGRGRPPAPVEGVAWLEAPFFGADLRALVRSMLVESAEFAKPAHRVRRVALDPVYEDLLFVALEICRAHRLGQAEVLTLVMAASASE